MIEAASGLRQIERLLVQARLEPARDLAATYTDLADEPGLGPWNAFAASMRIQAKLLTEAPTLPEATVQLAMLTATCGGCHRATQAAVRWFAPTSPPLDSAGLDARMARHRWAADELFVAMVASVPARWRAGIDILAAEPVEWPGMPSSARGYASELQRLALGARDAGARLDTNGPAVQAYGSLLAQCASCHAAEWTRQRETR